MLKSIRILRKEQFSRLKRKKKIKKGDLKRLAAAEKGGVNIGPPKKKKNQRQKKNQETTGVGSNKKNRDAGGDENRATVSPNRDLAGK